MNLQELEATLKGALMHEAIGDEFADRIARGMAPRLLPPFRRSTREYLAASFVSAATQAVLDTGLGATSSAVVTKAFDLADAFLAKLAAEDGKR